MNLTRLNTTLLRYGKQSLYFSLHVLRSFIQDGCTYRAAALTFTSLLAMVPLIVVSFKILSIFPAFHDLGNQIQNFVFDNFVTSASKVIQGYLQTFTQQATQLSMVGIIFLLITAIMMMFTIEQALNNIWRIKTGRKGLSAFFRYWAVLTLTPLLIGFSLVISSYLLSLPFISSEQTGKSLLGLMPVIFILIGFTVLYVGVPNCRVRIYHGLIGAFIATLLFEIAKKGFSLYLQNFPTYNLLYGAFSAIPIFLIWVYLSWLIILFGAEVAHALGLYYQYTTQEKWDNFTHAFRWLGYLWQAQQRGQALSLIELIEQDDRHYELEPDVMLLHLRQSDLVAQTRTGDYVLKKDLSHFTLYDLYKCLPWRLPLKQKMSSHDPWQNHFNQSLDAIDQQLSPVLEIPLAKFYQAHNNEKNQ